MTIDLCGICHQEILTSQEPVQCPADKTHYHRTCWNYNHGCGVHGCIHNPTTRDFVAVSPDLVVRAKQASLPVAPARQKSRKGLVVAGLLAMLACGFVLLASGVFAGLRATSQPAPTANQNNYNPAPPLPPAKDPAVSNPSSDGQADPPNPTYTSYPSYTPYPTDSPLPPASTPVPSPRIYNFQACVQPCTGSNSTNSFPERIKIIYLQWQYENIPSIASYVRYTSFGGLDWARYECTWPNPSAGRENLRFTEPAGIRSGDWTFTVEIDSQVLLQEHFTVQGNWDYWDPAGLFYACYGVR
jgi:hypothetical protein